MLHVRIWLSVVVRGVFFSKLPTWPPLWRPRHLLQHLTPRKLQMVTNDSNEKIKRFWLAGICSTNFFYAFFRFGIRTFNRKIRILQVEHADVIASYQHFLRIRSCSLVLLWIRLRSVYSCSYFLGSLTRNEWGSEQQTAAPHRRNTHLHLLIVNCA